MLLVERKSVAECLIVHHLKSAAGKAEYAQLCKGVKKLVEKYKKNQDFRKQQWNQHQVKDWRAIELVQTVVFSHLIKCSWVLDAESSKHMKTWHTGQNGSESILERQTR